VALSRFVLLIAFLSAAGMSTTAKVRVVDDSDREIVLTGPAERIISLAPNLTELLFVAGTGDRIVGTVRYSDYPEAAKSIPRIGDSHHIDLEAVIALRPDLIVAWKSGTEVAALEKLLQFNVPLYLSEPDTLEKIPLTIEKFGKLGGTATIADRRGRRLREDISKLSQQYAGRRKIRVFYQFWHRPMYTVNGEHLISHIIELCGGENIFSHLPSLTPRIDAESVLAKNPDVIIASGTSARRPPWLDQWRRWPSLAAVTGDRLHDIPPDLILRHTPRIIQGTKMMCEYIDGARGG